MAGTPKRRAELAAMRERLDELCDLLADGCSDREAMRRMGFSGTGALYKLQELDSAAADRLARARRAGADAMASDTLDIADELDLHPLVDPVRVAAHRISTRQWLAARRNREAYGDAKGVSVQLNVGSLHLTALRSDAPALPVIEGEAVEVQRESEPTSLDDLL